MIYSRSAEYAIRALTHIAALPDGKFAMARDIAAQDGIPPHFLAKILQDMVRAGFLTSSKGPGGGFRLRAPSAEISLLKIVDAVEGAGRYHRCISGHPECNDRVECGMHDSWMELRSRIIGYLEGTSVADLAEALAGKRRAQAGSRQKGLKRGAGQKA